MSSEINGHARKFSLSGFTNGILAWHHFSVEKVLWEFSNIRGISPNDIDAGTWAGKRLRGELLVKLKDNPGLKYKEIAEMSVFGNLSFNSLRELYRRTKQSKT